MANIGKKRYSIDELRAFKLAYGRSIQREDYVINIILPAALVGIMTHLLLHYLFLTIIMTILGGVYGYMVLFPANIKRFYDRRSFEQRNKFINTMTQLQMASNVSVFMALNDLIDLTEGDFKEQLIKLTAQLADSSEANYHEAFQEFSLHYEKDVIFGQYVDILETIMVEGSENVESLKKTTSFHNDIKNFQKRFIDNKNRTLRFAKTGHLLIMAAVLACHFKIEPITFENYVTYFSHHPIGWFVYVLYLVGTMMTMTNFMKIYFDDDVLEVEL